MLWPKPVIPSATLHDSGPERERKREREREREREKGGEKRDCVHALVCVCVCVCVFYEFMLNHHPCLQTRQNDHNAS